METIKIYLETMFSALPKTEEVARLKSELLVSMEEKYNELKAAGKSENEAVGTVISEFGNVDELTEEMGIRSAEEADDGEIYLTRDETMEYLAVMKRSGFWFGIGVWLIMTGVALLILIGGYGVVNEPVNSLVDAISLVGETVSDAVNAVLSGSETEERDFRGAVGVFVLLMFIAGAVPLFIVHGMKLEPYEVLESKKVRLDTETRAEIEMLDRENNSRFVWSMAGGVALILFAVAAFILFGVIVADEYGSALLSLMLFAIGLAVYIFITAGMKKGAYECLLGKGDYASIHKKINSYASNNSRRMERIIGVAAAFFWPLVVAAYLLWSFVSGDWHITWVVWPICGLIFGAFAGAIGAYYSLGGGEKNEGR
ncbi:MAG: permease prefix domain 1-containing protein [Oscillospiraceae bacterium]|nr:permease prefix domain 1-containing protein [Oscillospiraceae bacterium]